MKTEHSFFSRKSDTTIMRRTADDSPLDTKIQQKKMKIEENQTLMAPNQHSFVMNYVIDSIRCFSLAKSNLLIEGKNVGIPKIFQPLSTHTNFCSMAHLIPFGID